MKKIMWKVILGFTAVLLGMAPLMGQFVLSQEVVDGEVKNIVAQLKKMQSWDGSFNYDTIQGRNDCACHLCHGIRRI